MGIIYKALIRKETLSAVLLIIALTSLVYANSLKNSFAGDDYLVIVDNDFIKSWKNFPLIFSRSYLKSLSRAPLPPGSGKGLFETGDMGSGQVTYRPVITIFHFIDYSIWKLNPFGYHLTNLLLHISNVLLLYFFIGLITGDRKIARWSCLLFALHPVNSEPVNGIAFRGDLLAFLFYISSFILFIKADYYKGLKRLFSYIPSMALFSLALFSKETAITFPVLLILYDYYFVFHGNLKKIFTHLCSRYLGYITVSLFYIWVWLFLMGDIGQCFLGYPGGNFYTNILTMSKVAATYIGWLFLPLGIHITLPYDSSYAVYSFFTPLALFSVCLVITCLILAVGLYKRTRLLSFAIIWFFITLLPVLNILPISYLMAPRYLYIPGIGFYLFVSVLLVKLSAWRVFSIPPEILKKVSKDIIALLLVFYSTFTIIRSFAWRNNIAFWLELVEHYPDNAKVHRALGACFIRRGLLDKAIDEYKKTISLDPGLAMAYNDLGVCFGEKREYQKAIDYLKRAVKIDPRCTEAYNNLGVAYVRMRDYHRAKKVLERALEIEPGNKEVQDNLKKLKLLNRG